MKPLMVNNPAPGKDIYPTELQFKCGKASDCNSNNMFSQAKIGIIGFKVDGINMICL